MCLPVISFATSESVGTHTRRTMFNTIKWAVNYARIDTRRSMYDKTILPRRSFPARGAASETRDPRDQQALKRIVSREHFLQLNAKITISFISLSLFCTFLEHSKTITQHTWHVNIHKRFALRLSNLYFC